MTKYECAVYTALLESGELSAKKVAEHSKVPPTAVYPNLLSLVEKRLVQRMKGKVSTFACIPSDQAIIAFLEEKKLELKEKGKAALQYCKSIKKKEPVKEREVLTTTCGRELSAQAYLSAMKRTKKSFFILGWKFEKTGDKYSFLHKFRSLRKSGVDVRVILTGTMNKRWSLVEAYKSAGIPVRYLPLDNFSIFTSDGKECKITLKSEDLPDRVNVHILDESFAKSLELYFLDLWKRAKEL